MRTLCTNWKTLLSVSLLWLYRTEYNEELHQFYSPSNVIRGDQVTERVMGWTYGTYGTQDTHKHGFDREV
jgi:hypothetical protein